MVPCKDKQVQFKTGQKVQQDKSQDRGNKLILKSTSGANSNQKPKQQVQQVIDGDLIQFESDPSSLTTADNILDTSGLTDQDNLTYISETDDSQGYLIETSVRVQW